MRIRHIFLWLLGVQLATSLGFAQEPILTPLDNEATQSVSIDEALALPRLDSMLVAWSEQQRKITSEQLLNPLISIDTLDLPASNVPDSVYVERLKAIGSAIPMSYNEVVRKYIISYTTRHREHISRILGRSLYYFPIFEAELDARGLPLELRMLPVIESSLVPKARSKVGASGLWQFMYSTGKGYGLEVTSFIDQRFQYRQGGSRYYCQQRTQRSCHSGNTYGNC